MQILVITRNPDGASFRQRIGVYREPLRQRGIELEVVRLGKGFFVRRRQFARGRDFDGVLLHKKMLNAFDAPVLRRAARRLVFNYDDAILYSMRRPQQVSRSRRRPFLRTVRLADAVLVGSEYLAGFSRSRHSNVHVLPLGLQTKRYAEAADSAMRGGDGRIRLVWIGSRTTLGYLEELRAHLEQIGARHPNVTLRIIGDDFFELSNMAVEKVKWDRESRFTALAECDIGLAPLPDDPFTQGKCSFKVLEYSASGLAVVASPVGTNPDHVIDGESGYLVRGPEDWARRIEVLIEDVDLRRRMGQAGRAHAEKHDVEVIADRFAGVLRACIGG